MIRDQLAMLRQGLGHPENGNRMDEPEGTQAKVKAIRLPLIEVNP